MKGKNQKVASSSGVNPVAFFGEVKQELKKISWTTKPELQLYTKVTVISTVVMGFAVYFADLILRGALVGIDQLVKGIFG